MLARISHEVFITPERLAVPPMRYWQNNSLIEEYLATLGASGQDTIFADGKIVAGVLEWARGANSRMLNWVCSDALQILLQNRQRESARILQECDGHLECLFGANVHISWRTTRYVSGCSEQPWFTWLYSGNQTEEFAFHLDVAGLCSVIVAYDCFSDALRSRSLLDSYNSDKSSVIFF